MVRLAVVISLLVAWFQAPMAAAGKPAKPDRQRLTRGKCGAPPRSSPSKVGQSLRAAAAIKKVAMKKVAMKKVSPAKLSDLGGVAQTPLRFRGPIERGNDVVSMWETAWSRCRVSRSGVVSCAAGPRGQPDLTDDDAWTSVPGVTGAQRVVSRASLGCAIGRSGALRCWGKTTAPKPVPGLPRVTALALGAKHQCAIVPDGRVACWGDNSKGQLAAAGVATTSKPTVPCGVPRATAVAAGMDHTCVLDRRGNVTCWGGGLPAKRVAGVSKATMLAAGGDYTCAVVAGKDVVCWGDSVQRFTTVRAADGVKALAVGDDLSCAVTGDSGRAVCWDEMKDDPDLVDVGGPHIRSVSSRREDPCLLAADGSMTCWSRVGVLDDTMDSLDKAPGGSPP